MCSADYERRHIQRCTHLKLVADGLLLSAVHVRNVDLGIVFEGIAELSPGLSQTFAVPYKHKHMFALRAQVCRALSEMGRVKDRATAGASAVSRQLLRAVGCS